MKLRAAYRHHVDHDCIPWANRLGLGALLAAVMVVAGVSGGAPWWLTIPLALVWPGPGGRRDLLRGARLRAGPAVSWGTRLGLSPRAEVDRLSTALREIAALHWPEPIEIEEWHDPDARGGDDGVIPMRCPTAKPHRWANGHVSQECPGHERTIQCCIECGTTVSTEGDGIAYREWPCPTIQRIRNVLPDVAP